MSPFLFFSLRNIGGELVIKVRTYYNAPSTLFLKSIPFLPSITISFTLFLNLLLLKSSLTTVYKFESGLNPFSTFGLESLLKSLPGE